MDRDVMNKKYICGERIILSPECVAEGAAELAKHVPEFAQALDQTGPLPLRLRGDGFIALLDAICSQQISVAAADAIWRKLEAQDLLHSEAIGAASDEALRACGLSRQKIRYARALAQSGIDYDGLRETPAEEVSRTLTKITGIGEWTAQIYLMFSLGRADAFAAGDLALQESARLLFDLEARPTPKVLLGLAEDWRPWRGVAARLLWDYYRIIKNREGIKT